MLGPAWRAGSRMTPQEKLWVLVTKHRAWFEDALDSGGPGLEEEYPDEHELLAGVLELLDEAERS